MAETSLWRILSVFYVFSNASVLFAHIQVEIFPVDHLLFFHAYDLKVFFTVDLHQFMQERWMLMEV